MSLVELFKGLWITMPLIGLALAALGAYVLWDERKFSKTAIRGRGRVVDFAAGKSRGRNQMPAFSPVIGYRYKGQDYRLTGRVASSSPTHSVGDQVSILIAPDDPTAAQLAGPGMRNFAAAIVLIGVAMVVGFFFMFDFSMGSLIGAAGVFVLLCAQGILKLRDHDIHGLQDLKAVVAKLKREHRHAEPAPPGEEANPTISETAASAQEQGRRRAPAWLSVGVLVVAVGLLIGGGFVAKQRSHFLLAAHKAPGQVIGFRRTTSVSDGRTRWNFFPQVRFRPQGHTAPVTFEHDVGSNPPDYRSGEKVTVLYEPQHPENAIIDEGWMNWFGPALMIVIGIALAVLVGLERLRHRRATSQD